VASNLVTGGVAVTRGKDAYEGTDMEVQCSYISAHGALQYKKEIK
jgi:hypothetical protein